MNINMMTQTLKTINKGTWFKLSYTSDLPLTAKAKREGYVAYKRTNMTARYGIRYSNISAVKQKMMMKAMETGTPVPEKHELSWGEWVPGYEGILIEHKNNKYLRIYTSPNKSKVEYYVNGQPITKAGLQTLGILQNSYWNKKDGEVPDCLTIKVENIDTIG